ncbi:ABC-type cobalamin/Fe3+-siderophores transport systems ATPase components [Desulfocucumis palustris]|uniref:ABC-type cobalamin/Fe3+-siderophores transport systems ATPase components n=1 Tax=Desulfocucumis palustris TaxID=1898651 RepID=A0A2L2XFR2_9FIRM|nr:ABC transporter ATP-binding protein [Desulfocucumis palustris]GBF35177.1 ABC-type cobalamin/Fe3+-siderophores transport systems ATPase components [Desulfocucumis palustris]
MRLELKNVTCGYGSKPVVHQVSLPVDSGEVLYLLGPNGSGKTTLFKTMLGLLRLQGGEILCGGENIGNWPRSRIARFMGYIPQAHNPPFPYKVLDIVLMGRTAHLGAFASPSENDQKIALEAIEALNISHLQNKIYTEISGGERQLVLIARALAQQPQVLIMDEPTSNLDFGNQLLVLRHVQKLAQMGLAVVMSSHFPEHALLSATKVLLLHKGKVFGAGRPEEMITEQSLKTLFGVDVKIITTTIRKGGETRVIVPLVQ